MKIDLVELSKADLLTLTELINRPEVGKWIFRDDRIRREWEIEQAITEAKDGTVTKAYGLLPVRGGDIVGCIALQDICPWSRTGTIGFLASYTVYQAIAACREIVKRGFESLNLNRIDCRYIEGNPLTPTILKRTFGKQEAVLREMIYQNGSYKDVHIWSLLKRDWDGTPTA